MNTVDVESIRASACSTIEVVPFQDQPTYWTVVAFGKAHSYNETKRKETLLLEKILYESGAGQYVLLMIKVIYSKPVERKQKRYRISPFFASVKRILQFTETREKTGQ